MMSNVGEVWIVEWGHYDEQSIEAIFDNEAAAQAYAESQRHNITIREVRLSLHTSWFVEGGDHKHMLGAYQTRAQAEQAAQEDYSSYWEVFPKPVYQSAEYVPDPRDE